jgi:hypothetical protein
LSSPYQPQTVSLVLLRRLLHILERKYINFLLFRDLNFASSTRNFRCWLVKSRVTFIKIVLFGIFGLTSQTDPPMESPQYIVVHLFISQSLIHHHIFYSLIMHLGLYLAYLVFSFVDWYMDLFMFSLLLEGQHPLLFQLPAFDVVYLIQDYADSKD